MSMFERRTSRRGAFATMLVILAVVGLAAPSLAIPGAVVWTARFDRNTADLPVANVVSPDGTRLFVTGSSIVEWYDYTTIAYNTSTGARVWTKYYNGPDNGDDFATAMTTSPDGSKVFVTGESESSPGENTDYATVALNAATGAQLWAQRYHRPYIPGAFTSSAPVAIGTSPDGSKVFVTGTSRQDFVTVAYSAASGAALWSKTYSNLSNAIDTAADLQVSNDGTKVFVTGQRRWGDNGDLVTIAYTTANGTALWVKFHTSAGAFLDQSSALTVSPDGSKVFVTGYTGDATNGGDYVTIAYGATTGSIVWFKRTNSAGNRNDKAHDIGVSPDGSKVFVTGTSRAAPAPGAHVVTSDYFTVAYEATTGGLLWAKRYDTTAPFDFSRALAVSPDGARVYVTGDTAAGYILDIDYNVTFTGNDFATIAYAAGTGTVAWTRRYDFDGPTTRDEDMTKAVKVSPSSARVYVTGVSAGDYLTVAYSAN